MFLDRKETSWCLSLSPWRKKAWAGFEAWCESRFCCQSHWKSESHPEQLRPPGREAKGNGCNFSLPSESHDITFLPGLSGFSYKKGWGEALCTHLCQTPPQCICWAWKLRHPPLLAFTEPAGHFAMHISVKRISCWFSFLETGITKWWTASNSIKLNACAQLLIGFGF